MEYMFTADFTNSHADDWLEYLDDYIAKENVIMLEIGTYEGRSALWFIENILTHETSSIICIDPRPQKSFYTNISKYRHKIRLIQERSQIGLRDRFFKEDFLDLVYIDGNHIPCDVLEDAILSFRPLKKGGLLIFDDYLYKEDEVKYTIKDAIDCFLSIFSGKYDLIQKKYQVIIQKL